MVRCGAVSSPAGLKSAFCGAQQMCGRAVGHRGGHRAGGFGPDPLVPRARGRGRPVHLPLVPGHPAGGRSPAVTLMGLFKKTLMLLCFFLVSFLLVVYAVKIFLLNLTEALVCVFFSQ